MEKNTAYRQIIHQSIDYRSRLLPFIQDEPITNATYPRRYDLRIGDTHHEAAEHKGANNGLRRHNGTTVGQGNKCPRQQIEILFSSRDRYKNVGTILIEGEPNSEKNDTTTNSNTRQTTMQDWGITPANNIETQISDSTQLQVHNISSLNSNANDISHEGKEEQIE